MERDCLDRPSIAWMISSVFDNCTARVLVTPNLEKRPELKRRPVHLVRASAIALVWPSLRSGLARPTTAWDIKLFDFDTYALCSDGDLMEGVSSEAASLAGHLKLSNLCWIYDDNKITIEGAHRLAFSENVARRFEGLGWNTVRVDDANDLEALSKALKNFKACSRQADIDRGSQHYRLWLAQQSGHPRRSRCTTGR